MSELHSELNNIEMTGGIEKRLVVDDIKNMVENFGYSIVEQNDTKPWGAYFRLDSDQADNFVSEFFPGLSPNEARLGIEGAELSPKILLVSPGQRLSWQYHNRRAERWVFLTRGAYNKSQTDSPGQLFIADVGEVVQFDKGERHRLVGKPGAYTIVAEIWQHTDPLSPSNEDDIIRLEDDYNRN